MFDGRGMLVKGVEDDIVRYRSYELDICYAI